MTLAQANQILDRVGAGGGGVDSFPLRLWLIKKAQAR